MLNQQFQEPWVAIVVSLLNTSVLDMHSIHAVA